MCAPTQMAWRTEKMVAVEHGEAIWWLDERWMPSKGPVRLSKLWTIEEKGLEVILL